MTNEHPTLILNTKSRFQQLIKSSSKLNPTLQWKYSQSHFIRIQKNNQDNWKSTKYEKRLIFVWCKKPSKNENIYNAVSLQKAEAEP